MKKLVNSIVVLMIAGLSFACSDDEPTAVNMDNFPINENVRVPAEWETHAATWMQWANEYDAIMRPAFADIIKAVKQYEPMHLITSTEAEKAEAIEYLANRDISQDNIIWHIFPMDNSWMRDSGPIYVTDGSKAWIQNWKFNGWGSGFGGDVEWQKDNQIPVNVASYLGLDTQDIQEYVLEKGNIEVNGKGLLLINWDCQNERNPQLSKQQHETILMNALGVTKIIWSYGHYKDDGTYGHIDGIVRFIDENTVAVADYGTDIENNMAQSCKDAGLEVIMYPGDPNWLVGNGFVVAMGEDGYNEELKSQIESFFPGRDVYMVDGSKVAKMGGGIHCVTNDQPLFD